jgi:nicotinamidase-related amidase
MLLSAGSSQLLVVDIQERLLPAMADGERVVANVRKLITAARRLNVPVTASEQYPKGIGHTVASVAEALGEAPFVFPKVTFSCARDEAIADRLARVGANGRRQIVVCGIEAHVCVLQSALDLGHAGYEVAVVADAVSSRQVGSRELAFGRLGPSGVAIVNTEMVLFEWVERAGTAAFKDVLALIK